MQLIEFYETIGGDYESVKDRIMKDEIIVKFLTKFLSEPSYGVLCKALEEKDYKEAFRAAHSIKGICANLGFPRLGDSSGNLTEYLRNKETEEVDEKQCEELLGAVTADYDTVMDALRKYVEV